jgi:hypothetical protein
MNDPDYSEFYQLHIPKTAGLSLYSFLNTNLFSILEKNNINIFNYNDRKTYHCGWQPVKDNQYVISSFRNPSKRVVSHFFWMLKLRLLDNAKITRENKHKYSIGSKVKDYNNPTNIEFFSWIEKNSKWVSDYQSKNFFYRENDLVVPTCVFGCSPPLSINEFNKDEVLNNIKRTNLLIKSEDIKLNNFNNLMNKILIDLNIENKNKIKLTTNAINTNEKSLKFYNSLSKKEIEYIESLNTLDLEIYNTDSFFWDPKAFI